MTLVVVGSGIGLGLTGPNRAGPLLALHNVGFLIWLPLAAIHVFAHIRRVPGLVSADWREPHAARSSGRGRRLGANLGALAAGAVGALLLLPDAAPWVPRLAQNQDLPAPLIVGLVLATIALLAARPLRWDGT
jgi:hypothetical protein